MRFMLVLLMVIFLVVLDVNCKTTILHRKRNLLQFKKMIKCETGRSIFDYIDYGCHCGIGGKGRPVDDLDRCCYGHDECYKDLANSRSCHFKVSVYLLIYKYKGCSQCAKPNDYSWWELLLESAECKAKLCDCDAIAARCFKSATYNDIFRNYDQTFCN